MPSKIISLRYEAKSSEARWMKHLRLFFELWAPSGSSCQPSKSRVRNPAEENEIRDKDNKVVLQRLIHSDSIAKHYKASS